MDQFFDHCSSADFSNILFLNHKHLLRFFNFWGERQHSLLDHTDEHAIHKIVTIFIIFYSNYYYIPNLRPVKLNFCWFAFPLLIWKCTVLSIFIMFSAMCTRHFYYYYYCVPFAAPCNFYILNDFYTQHFTWHWKGSEWDWNVMSVLNKVILSTYVSILVSFK